MSDVKSPVLDLTSPGLPPALGQAFSQLEGAFRRLTQDVQDMTQEELDYLGPAGNVNSTATLLGHLAVVDLEYLYCIKGERMPPELEAAYGLSQTQIEDGPLPQVAGKSVSELLDRYQQVLHMSREYLQTLSDADATRAVTVEWWSKPATVRFVLWHMAGHSMWHQGQISRLREWYKLRGA